MLDEGWALTPETGGIAARDGYDPSKAPVVAWVHTRDSESTLVLGGRYIADSGAPPSRLSVGVKGSTLAAFQVRPGFFYYEVPVPAGRFSAAPGYVPMQIAATAPPRATVSLEQFDVQPPGVPMTAYEAGWQEPEYNPSTGSSWRWISDRAVLWVRPVGRTVTLHVAGESTRKYFKQTPRVRVLAGNRDIGGFDTDEDFDQSFTISAEVLAAADSRVTFVSSAFFVPGGPSGGGDQRHLSARIYSIDVR